MKQTPVSSVFFFALLLFFIFQALRLLSPFFGPLLCALTVAIACQPMHRALGQRFKKLNPSLRALLSDMAVLLFIVVPVSAIVTALISEGQSIIPDIKSHSGDWIQSVKNMLSGNHAYLNFLPTSVVQAIQSRSDDIKAQLSAMGDHLLGSLAGLAGEVARNIARVATDLILFLFILFFLFRDGPSYYQRWNELLPIAQASKTRLHERLKGTVEGVVRGVLIIGLIQGTIFMIGYFIVGARAAVLLGATTMLLSVIPGIGTALVWGPLCVYFFFSGALWKSLVLIGFGIGTGVLDNLIRPIIVGRKSEISFLWLTFALLGGIEIFGIEGLILGPLIFAMLPILFDIYHSAFIEQRPS